MRTTRATPTLDPHHSGRPAVVVDVWFHAGVWSADTHVGRLPGVRTVTTTGRISAAIVDVGHRWHHRHVAVPASHVDEPTDLTVWLRGSRQEIRHLAAPADGELAAELTAVEPRDLGVGARGHETPIVEASHLVTEESR